MTEIKSRIIKSHLAILGVSCAQLAREIGVTRQLVSKVVRGERKNEKVREALIQAGVPRALLFDENEAA